MNITYKFEQIVTQYNDRVALASEYEGELSYRELNNYANYIAQTIIINGLNKRPIIGICISRSFKMIATMLGVLKAGLAYVPIDPSYPSERISYYIENSEIEYILCDENSKKAVSEKYRKIVLPKYSNINEENVQKFIDEEGNNLDKPNVIGEMVYEGPNVTLGYAQSREDLLLGDERHSVLHTGDMAKMDEDGCFYIVGRKKRFLKLWGYRVGLDECENLIKSAFEVECACTGDDKCMKIFVTSSDHVTEIKKYISNKTNINSSAFQVQYVESIPRNEAGKILYSKLVQ